MAKRKLKTVQNKVEPLLTMPASAAPIVEKIELVPTRVWVILAGLAILTVVLLLFRDRVVEHDQRMTAASPAISITAGPGPSISDGPVTTQPPTEEIKPIGPELVKKSPTDFVKIRDMRKYYLQVERVDGKIELRTGGNTTWRFNNPGRMLHSDFTRMMGAIGSDRVISVFPSYAAGVKAMEAYLFTDASGYKDKTLAETFIDSKLSKILAIVGVPKTTRLSELSEDQRDRLLMAIQQAEGWAEGKVTVFDDEKAFLEKGW